MSRDWRPIREHPDYSHRHHPQVGDIIAVNGTYCPWIVAEIRTYGDDGYALALREVGTLDLAASVTHHIAVPKLPHPALHVLPERYALCSCCGELAPCSAETEDRTVAAMAERDARYATAGVCPACMEVIGTRQQSWTCSTNLHVPLGPPVTFHRRRKCWAEALRYEARVAALEKRQPALSCWGYITDHVDQPSECTNPSCPGAHLPHTGGFNRTCLHYRCADCAAIQTATTERTNP